MYCVAPVEFDAMNFTTPVGLPLESSFHSHEPSISTHFLHHSIGVAVLRVSFCHGSTVQCFQSFWQSSSVMVLSSFDTFLVMRIHFSRAVR